MIREEINELFDEYCDIDYKGSNSINVAIQHVGGIHGQTKDKRGYGIAKKSSGLESNYEHARMEKLIIFSNALIENGSLKYAMYISGLGEKLSRWCINTLNKSAEKSGSPLIFIKKPQQSRNRKLNEKQVSYIKYLVTKYSFGKLGRIYNVAPYTISLIKRGFLWGHVLPAIVNHATITLYNLDSIEGKEMFSEIAEEKARNNMQYYRWGEVPVCPFCKKESPYILMNKKTFRCRNEKCRKDFTVTTGTIFENTKLKISVWMKAIDTIKLNPNITTCELAKNINVTQKTAWKVKKRLENIYSPLKKQEVSMN